MENRGGKRDGAGRPKGSPNKDVKEIRDAFQMLIEDNLDNMKTWLERVADKNPAKAMELINGLSDYIIPKLSRTEVKAEVEQKNTIDLSKLPNDVLDKLIDDSNDTGAEG